jgi:hypothetical protein
VDSAASTLLRGDAKAEAAARRARRSKTGRVLSAAGLTARAIAYLVLGGIALDILLGARTKQASSTGAFEEVAHQPAGPVLLSILALGLAAYALWRFLQAAAGDSRGGVVQRIGRTVLGVGYMALAWEAFHLAVSGVASNSSVSNTEPLARRVLEFPAGQFLLAFIGTAIAGGGIGLLVWAGSQGFSRYLHLRSRPKVVEVGGRAVETFGQGTRGALITAIGVSLFVAAVQNRPRDSKGLDAALLSLAGRPGTSWIVGAIAGGLLAFGLASVVEAIYRQP